MARQWIRLYSASYRNPKLNRLQDHLFRFLVNCWCMCGDSDSATLPKAADIAFHLRIEPVLVESYLAHLESAGYLDRDATGNLIPHDWDEHQREHDNSTERSRKSRERKKSTHATLRNVAATLPSESVSVSVSQSKEGGVGETMRPEFDDQWQDFCRLYRETGKPLIEQDFHKAWFTWRLLDFEQKTHAIVNLAARKLHHDPQFIPNPEKYLHGGEYLRKVVPHSNRNGRMTLAEMAKL